MGDAVAFGAAGSSPLARGLRNPPPEDFSEEKDHPRSRGVYQTVDIDGDTNRGSSPLARGLRGCGGCPSGRGRIIPARAGFTRLLAPQGAPWQDHPRSRGVYGRSGTPDGHQAGSSPLARGLLSGARVGFNKNGDHPRSRGVYDLGADEAGFAFGSSPLARGLRRRRRRLARPIRIIPARAGFTPPGRFFRRKGSSPLARGLRAQAVAVADLRGIIPARAGFTPRA